MTYKIISKDELYNIINPLDVCYNVVNRDYSIEMIGNFSFRSGRVIAKTVSNYDLLSDSYGETAYYIDEDFYNSYIKIT